MNKVASARLQSVSHYLAGLVILLKGLSKLDIAASALAYVFIITGAVVIIATVFHQRIHRHERVYLASLYLIEAVVMALVAWTFASEGKKGLPVVFGIAAFLFAVAFVVMLFARRKSVPAEDVA